MRRLIVGLLCVTVVAAGLIAQDKPAGDPEEPPVRLKKKAKAPTPPQEEPAKPADKDEPGKQPPPEEKRPKLEKIKPDDEPAGEPADQPDMDEQEVLNRVVKNARTAEERIANKETDERTRQIQRDILKDLDSLIDQTRQGQQQAGEQQDDQQQQDQKGQGQQQQQQQKGGMGSKSRRMPGQQASKGMGRRQGSQMARGGKQRGKGQGEAAHNGGGSMPEQGQTAQGQGGNGKQGGAGNGGSEELNKLADIYKDIWGSLPEGLRNEMNAYNREEFMMKYKDVLKQYYATVAEKGRRKD
jgi:hypothetical protein